MPVHGAGRQPRALHDLRDRRARVTQLVRQLEGRFEDAQPRRGPGPTTATSAALATSWRSSAVRRGFPHTHDHTADGRQRTDSRILSNEVTIRKFGETADGIIVRGGAGVLAPLTPYADSVSASGADPFDKPLSSRFDEQDAFCIFDDVLVPRDRIFIDGDGDVDIYNSMRQTGYATSVTTQSTVAPDQARVRLRPCRADRRPFAGAGEGLGACRRRVVSQRLGARADAGEARGLDAACGGNHHAYRQPQPTHDT